MLKVAVLKGGMSSEREVSLVSGAACAAALRDAGYEVTEIDVTFELREQLKTAARAAVFSCSRSSKVTSISVTS